MRLWFAFFAFSLVASAETIQPLSPPFTLEVPAGWTKSPETRAHERWVWVKQTSGGRQVYIEIEVLKSPASRENLAALSNDELKQRIDAPPGSSLTARRVRWQGIEINVFETEGPKDGGRALGCQAIVPVRWHAIQLSTLGMMEDADAVRAELDRGLAALRGEIGWRPRPYEEHDFWPLYVLYAIGYLGAIAYGVVYLIAFSWRADFALAFRFRWQAVNALLILVMTMFSQVIVGRPFPMIWGDPLESSLSPLWPSAFLFFIVLSWKRLKARHTALHARPSPPMPEPAQLQPPPPESVL